MAMAKTREISTETELVSEVEGSESESERSELTDDPPLQVLIPAMTLLVPLVTVSPCYLLV